MKRHNSRTKDTISLILCTFFYAIILVKSLELPNIFIPKECTLNSQAATISSFLSKPHTSLTLDCTTSKRRRLLRNCFALSVYRNEEFNGKSGEINSRSDDIIVTDDLNRETLPPEMELEKYKRRTEILQFAIKSKSKQIESFNQKLLVLQDVIQKVKVKNINLTDEVKKKNCDLFELKNKLNQQSIKQKKEEDRWEQSDSELRLKIQELEKDRSELEKLCNSLKIKMTNVTDVTSTNYEEKESLLEQQTNQDSKGDSSQEITELLNKERAKTKKLEIVLRRQERKFHGMRLKFEKNIADASDECEELKFQVKDLSVILSKSKERMKQIADRWSQKRKSLEIDLRKEKELCNKMSIDLNNSMKEKAMLVEELDRLNLELASLKDKQKSEASLTLVSKDNNIIEIKDEVKCLKEDLEKERYLRLQAQNEYEESMEIAVAAVNSATDHEKKLRLDLSRMSLAMEKKDAKFDELRRKYSTLRTELDYVKNTKGDTWANDRIWKDKAKYYEMEMYQYRDKVRNLLGKMEEMAELQREASSGKNSKPGTVLSKGELGLQEKVFDNERSVIEVQEAGRLRQVLKKIRPRRSWFLFFFPLTNK